MKIGVLYSLQPTPAEISGEWNFLLPGTMET